MKNRFTIGSYDPSERMEWTPVDYPGISEHRPIIGKRSFRYPREMTLDSRAADKLAPDVGEHTTLRFVEGQGEAVYLSAKMERLDDGAIRLFEITPLPLQSQDNVDFEPIP